MRTTHDEVDLALVVAERRDLTPRVCTLSLRRPDGGPLPSWSPGAHVDLLLGPDLVRQYSLYGDPADDSTWRVAVLLEEESRGGSTRVHSDLVAGSAVAVRGARNHFPLEEAGDYLFIAGGIGIAPLVPMVAEVDSRGASWKLVYGGRNAHNMAFADELSRIHGPRVRLMPEDRFGLLPLEELMTSVGEDTAVYCCGPEGLIAAVEQAHADTGRGALHVERFSPKDPGDSATTSTFEVEAARSGMTVTVGPDTSILEALTGAGLRLLSSCTEGICGTCEVSVLAGSPEHRDSILTDEERDAGETMFICVSRALSPRLVLDV